jgi:Fe-S-cluster containining protein
MTDWSICKGCAQCCGIIPFEPKFFAKHQHLAARPYEICEGKLSGAIYAVSEDGWCVFLDQNKLCRIYKDRPEICRLFGTIPELTCTHLRGEKGNPLAEELSARGEARKFLL